MKTGRFIGAVIAVWLVRTLINGLYYGVYMSDTYQAMADRFPGVFREVVPAYILADLLFAAVFVWLWAKVAPTFAAGAAGGATYGVVMWLVAEVITGIYLFYSFTFMTPGMWASSLAVQLVVYLLMGVVAAALIKPGAMAAAPAPA
jgi:hypothetical protein